MFSGNALGDPARLEERPTLACKYIKAMQSVNTWRTVAKERFDLRKRQGRAFTGLYTANTAADVKIYEDIYQPMGNKQFDDAVTLLVGAAVRVRDPALAGEHGVPAGVGRRGQPRPRRPADPAPGARPGPAEAQARDRQGEVKTDALASVAGKHHSDGPLEGPALAVRLSRARDLDRLPLHPAVGDRVRRC